MAAESRTLEIVARVKDFATSTFARMRGAVANFASSGVNMLRGFAAQVFDLRGVFGGLLAFLTVRRAFGFFSEIATGLDAVAKAVEKTQATAESLTALKHAGDLAGVGFDDLVTAAGRLARGFSASEEGTGKQAAAFAELGLSMDRLPLGAGGKVDMVELLAQMADGMTAIEDPTRRVSIVLDVFGRSGQKLLPLLTQGAAALREQADEAKRLGLVFDSATLKRAEAFNDSLTRVGAAFRGVFQELFLRVAPQLTAFFERLAVVIADNRDKVVDLFRSIGAGILSTLELVFTGLARFIGKLEALTGPLIDTSATQRELDQVEQKLRDLADLRASFAAPTLTKSTGGLFGLEGFPLGAGTRFGTQQTPEEQAFIQSEPALRRRVLELQTNLRGGLGDLMLREFAAVKAELREASEKFATGSGVALQGPPVAPLLGGDLAGAFEGVEPRIAQTEQLAEAVADVGIELEQVRPKARTFFEGFAAGAKRALDALTDLGELGLAAADRLIGGGLDRLGDVFADFITGAKNAGEAFRAFAQSMIADLARLAAQLAIVAVLRTLAGVAIGAGAGSALGGSAGTETFGGGAGALGGGGLAFAKGGVADAPVLRTVPFRAFAAGGIATGPTLALLGENSRFKGEAFVPLPDGKRIPVNAPGFDALASLLQRTLQRRSASSTTVNAPVVHFNIQGRGGQEIAEDIRAHAPMIEAIIVNALGNHANMREAALGVG